MIEDIQASCSVSTISSSQWSLSSQSLTIQSIVQEQVEAQTTWLSVETTQPRSEMDDLRDKVNVLKQLLSTLIGTCGLPCRPPGPNEDPPLGINCCWIIFFQLIIKIWFILFYFIFFLFVFNFFNIKYYTDRIWITDGMTSKISPSKIFK